MCSPDSWVGPEKDQPLDQSIWYRKKDAGEQERRSSSTISIYTGKCIGGQRVYDGPHLLVLQTYLYLDLLGHFISLQIIPEIC